LGLSTVRSFEKFRNTVETKTQGDNLFGEGANNIAIALFSFPSLANMKNKTLFVM
jgi:hypothetical protein